MLIFITNASLCQISDVNNILWIKESGGYGSSSLIVRTNSENNIYGCCTFNVCSNCFFTINGGIMPVDNNNFERILFYKLDPLGNLIYIDSIKNPTGNINLTGFNIDSNDNLIFYFYSETSFYFKGQIIYTGYNLLKLNNNLDFLWNQNITGCTHFTLERIYWEQLQIDLNDNILIGGNISLLSDYSHIIDTLLMPPDTFYIYASYYDTLKIGGQLFTTNTSNIFVSKFNSNGNCMWTKIFDDSTSTVYLNSISCDGIGNTYLFGGFYGGNWFINQDTLLHYSTSNMLAKNGFLIKVDANGNYQWAKSNFDDIQPESSFCDENNEIIISGSFFNTINYLSYHLTAYSNTQDILISKFNSNGDIVWAQRFGSNNTDEKSRIFSDLNGSIYTPGYNNHTHILNKFDSNGNYIEGLDPLVQSANINGFYTTNDIDGNIILSGNYQGYANFGQCNLTQSIGPDGQQFIMKIGNISCIKNQNSNAENISLFPIPVSNELFFTNSTKKSVKKIQVFDTSERMLIEKNIIFNNSINIDNFSPGVYFIYFIFSDEIICKRFIKL